jgi:lipid A 3-O-deacylase
MDALVAIFFVVTSVADMVLTDCRTDCLAPAAPTAQLSIQTAQLEHQDDWTTRETLVRFDAPIQHGPFQQIFSVGVSDSYDLWFGAGVKYSTQGLVPGRYFLETTFQPGLHYRGDGPDIGGILHFRSGVGVGYAFENGGALVLSYDHRSNADRTIPNPGLNTVSIRYAISLD